MRAIHRTLDTAVLAITIPLMVLMLACVVWQVVARYATPARSRAPLIRQPA